MLPHFFSESCLIRGHVVVFIQIYVNVCLYVGLCSLFVFNCQGIKGRNSSVGSMRNLVPEGLVRDYHKQNR